ncbi:hypothetical protein MBLNU459_g5676t2 [Dothideomycetes sp. NU459]
MQIWEPDTVGSCTESSKSSEQPTDISQATCCASSSSEDGARKIYDKFYGRGLTEDTVKDAFRTFLCLGTNQEVDEVAGGIIGGIEEAVGEIEDALAHEESRMYSASLLMVYEGDSQARHEAVAAAIDRTARVRDGQDGGQATALEEEDEDEEDESDEEEEDPKKLFEVRVIDFAHAEWTPGEGPDENILFGLRNVRLIISGLAKAKSKRP